MRILASIIFLAITVDVIAAPVWTSIRRFSVVAGYPDKSIAFIPRSGVVENPAGCADPVGYVIESDHDVEAALSILLHQAPFGKIFFSVRDDKCHVIQQSDGGQELPVVQRIAIPLPQ